MSNIVQLYDQNGTKQYPYSDIYKVYDDNGVMLAELLIPVLQHLNLSTEAFVVDNNEICQYKLDDVAEYPITQTDQVQSFVNHALLSQVLADIYLVIGDRPTV